jgi:hypothetical protein
MSFPRALPSHLRRTSAASALPTRPLQPPSRDQPADNRGEVLR